MLAGKASQLTIDDGPGATPMTESWKGKKVFRVIHTNKVDEYERAPENTRREKR
jgi:hypothetical protein